jgi:hypothetical protein
MSPLIIGFLAAATSGLAILLYAGGFLSLPASLTVLAPLTAIVFLVLLVRSGRAESDTFRERFRGGLLAGLAGLVAYDLIRLVILLTGMVPFNPFRPIEVYGLWILDRQADDGMTKAAGWALHIWNGLGFALMYTMAVGAGRIGWAVLWAMTLEAMMLATYPSMFRISLAWPLISISLIGHAAYGMAVGYVARRTIKS